MAPPRWSSSSASLFFAVLVSLLLGTPAETLGPKSALLPNSPGSANKPLYETSANGCKCLQHWSYEGQSFQGCAITPGVKYAWCKTSGEPMPCLGIGRSTRWDKCEPVEHPPIKTKPDMSSHGDRSKTAEDTTAVTRRRPPKKWTSKSKGALQPLDSPEFSEVCPCETGKGYCPKDDPGICRCLDRTRYTGQRCNLCKPGYTILNDSCVPTSPFAGVDGLVYAAMITAAVLFGCGICYYRCSPCLRSFARMRGHKRENLLEEFDIELHMSEITPTKSLLRSKLSPVPQETETAKDSVLIDLDEAVMDYVQIDSDALMDSLNEDGDLELVDSDDGC